MEQSKDKKIRILTFHSAYSYGAVLQTYGLFTFLKKHFKDVRVVDFRCPHFSITFNWKNIKSWLTYPKFSAFKRKIKFTRQIDAEELRSRGIEADILVIGSDQVWNQNITKDYSDIYLGNLGKLTENKISYAASIGKSELNDNEKNLMGEMLPKFSKVSVREKEAVDLCEGIGVKDVEHVIDPTFLIDDYNKLIGRVEEKDELGLFVLDNSSNECFEAALQISSKLGLKPKVINKAKKQEGFKVIPFPGIKKFLREIAKSKFMITNSYHGLAFSIIFRKQFAYVTTNPKLQSRAKSLLELCGLESRMFFSYDELKNSEIWDRKIDYNKVGNKLAPFIKKSKEFLISACE